MMQSTSLEKMLNIKPKAQILVTWKLCMREYATKVWLLVNKKYNDCQKLTGQPKYWQKYSTFIYVNQGKKCLQLCS